MTESAPASFSPRTAMTMALGTLTGILVAVPISIDASNAPNGLVLLAGAAAGALIGWRRRTSTGFLYFCAFAILTLASLISYQGYRPL